MPCDPTKTTKGTKGGVICPGTCGKCDDKVIKLRFKNIGSSLGTFLIKDGLDSPAVYNAIVNAGQEFESSGSDVDKGMFKSNNLEVIYNSCQLLGSNCCQSIIW
jgi:hypothetical protein